MVFGSRSPTNRYQAKNDHNGSKIEMSRMKSLAAGLCLATVLASGSAFAGDPDSCKAVRLSDVGWTDIQATTAVTSAILTALGYEPDVKVLSVPVPYASLKNKDIDVLLG